MGSLTCTQDDADHTVRSQTGAAIAADPADALRTRLIREVAIRLASEGVRSIALFGAGRHTRVILRQPWNDAGIEVKMILDDAPSRSSLGGIPIRKPEQGQEPKGIDAIVISSEHYEDHLAQRAQELFPATKLPIVRLYQTDANRYRFDETMSRLQEQHGLSAAEARWLIENRSERHDASVDMIAPPRRTLHQRRYELARELLDDINASSVADLACGTGYAATILTNSNKANYTGVDIDPQAVSYASRHHGGDRRSFFCASATSTPIEDASIDLVTSFETIEHVQDTSALVAEYARVLNKRGILVVSTPNKLGFTEHHVHDFSGDDLVAVLSEQFEVLSIIGQLANDNTYEPDLPPGMWHIDDADSQSPRPDYIIIIARLRDSARPMLTSSSSTDMLRVHTRHGTIPFFCPTDTVRWRAETLLTKEPDTIEWIDAFDEGDVFWDIGASTGPYTMYAAAAGRVSQIIALEPSPWNWWVLAEQVRRCHIERLVRTFPIAAGDQLCVNELHMRHPFPGGAGSSFGQPIGELGETFQPEHSQSSIGMPIDHLIQQLGLPLPNRMKIDVDGNEHAVLRGAIATLRQDTLRSVLIELDSDRGGLIEPVTRLLHESGFTLLSRGAPGTDPSTQNSSIRNYRFERS